MPAIPPTLARVTSPCLVLELPAMLPIPLSEIVAMLGLGAALGFLGGLFGMDQTMAQGTALVVMVPNLLIA